MIPRRLAGPSVQCAERKEDGGSEAGGPNSGIRQTGLLGRDHASKAAWSGAGFRISQNPGRTEVAALSDLVFSGTLYVDMLPAEVFTNGDSRAVKLQRFDE